MAPGRPGLVSSFLTSVSQRFSSYAPVPAAEGDEGSNTPGSSPVQRKPKLGQILRSKRARIIAATIFVIIVLASFYYNSKASFDLSRFGSSDVVVEVQPPTSPTPPSKPSAPEQPTQPAQPYCDGSQIDWSRFAYTQYVTNTDYLCNSVMLFEILHRLGSKADRLMMYPDSMRIDPESTSIESRLLLKAKSEYGVKLTPIEVQHRDSEDSTWGDSYTKLLAFNQTQYDRVLSLDSDSTILQTMDELFLLPPCPVAMPRAFWMEQPFLSSQMVLIQPSVEEFTRVKEAIDTASRSEFDMEIVNNLYGKDCMILPHRRYDLLTGLFRSEGARVNYTGNEYEKWDPEKMVKEAKFLHFSDWPYPKPWLNASPEVTEAKAPQCEKDAEGREDCTARDIWLGFYSDFKKRRQDICGMSPRSIEARSIDELETRPSRFAPRFE